MCTENIMRFSYLAGVLSIGAMAAGTNAAVNLDFETEGQFSSNFRLLEDEGTTGSGAPTATQSDNGIANDYLRITGGSGGSRYTTVYDTTPANATVRDTFAAGVTIELDARLSRSGQSIGIYLIDGDAAAENSAYLALFNVDQSGSNDLIRFSSNANPSSSTSTNTGTLTGDISGNSGYNNSATDFVHLTLTYNIDDQNRPVLDLRVGDDDFGGSITFETAAFSTVGIGFRASTSGQFTLDLDNIRITPVPEPASIALLAGAAAGLLRRRRA